jgi:hypothetical protein
MRIDVTASDIRRGIPNTCNLCHIAQALIRQTGVAWWVVHDRARPLIGDPGDWRPLPVEAQELIRAADAGEPVEPTSFEFDAEFRIPTPT